MATFQRYGQIQAPSNRYKDLEDLVAILTAASVDAEQQRVALWSEAERRGIPRPTRFVISDRALWERGYRAEAGRSLLPLPTRRRRRWAPESGSWSG